MKLNVESFDLLIGYLHASGIHLGVDDTAEGVQSHFKANLHFSSISCLEESVVVRIYEKCKIIKT